MDRVISEELISKAINLITKCTGDIGEAINVINALQKTVRLDKAIELK